MKISPLFIENIVMVQKTQQLTPNSTLYVDQDGQASLKPGHLGLLCPDLLAEDTALLTQEVATSVETPLGSLSVGHLNLYPGLGCPGASYQERDVPYSGLMPRIEVKSLVRQCSYLRERGEATKYIREIIHNICHVFENEILRAMYAWAPGKPLDRIDELADFIVRVRDVNGEFGERDVAYALLWTWYRFFPEWALRIFHRFVGGVGCWSDVKYMCGYLCEHSKIHTSVVFRDSILDIMIHQLKEDHNLWGRVMEAYFENRRQFFGIGEKYEGENENGGWKRPREPLMKRPCARKYLSLASKWCPRETSKYGWVFALLVGRFQTASPHDGFGNHLKYTRQLRHMISRLSRELNYLE